MSTFKEKVIAELLTVLPSENDEILAFIAGVARGTGTLHMKGKKKNLVFSLSSYDECIALVGLLKKLYPSEFEIATGQVESGVRKGSAEYSVAVPTGFTMQVLGDVKIFNEDGKDPLPESVLINERCAVAFLKGLFLGRGNIYIPSPSTYEDDKRAGYHFEYAFESEELATSVAAVMRSLGLNNVKISERGAYMLVYIKEKEEILKMLAVLNLSESAITLKAVIDDREMSNSINRITICEAANLDKTYEAASNQLMAIGLIEESIGLESLSPVLAKTAETRIEFPQASLAELAEILGVTKSCLNHRLRKITEIAKTLN